MVVNTARSILRARSMPGFFWGEAVHTAVYLLNRSPTAALDGLTPYQAWYGKKPPVHYLRVFGCVAYIKRLQPHPTKLEDHGQKVVFVGYEEGAKAYRFYDPATERVRVARDVVFDENAHWDWGSAAPDDSGPFTIEEEYELRRQPPASLTSPASGPFSHAATSSQPVPSTPPRTGSQTPPAFGAGASAAASTSREASSPATGAPIKQVESRRH